VVTEVRPVHPSASRDIGAHLSDLVPQVRVRGLFDFTTDFADTEAAGKPAVLAVAIIGLCEKIERFATAALPLLAAVVRYRMACVREGLRVSRRTGLTPLRWCRITGSLEPTRFRNASRPPRVGRNTGHGAKGPPTSATVIGSGARGGATANAPSAGSLPLSRSPRANGHLCAQASPQYRAEHASQHVIVLRDCIRDCRRCIS
jgi:hypothetical protein